MDNYFDREIEYLENELTNLKTAAQKSAGAIKTTSKTISVSVNLKYEDISYPTGSARAAKYYEVITDKDAIIIPTLSWYFGDVMEGANVYFVTREIRMRTGLRQNGNFAFELYFIGTEQGNNSDAARTKRGETVTVSVNLTVLCTQNFTLQEFTP